MAFHESIPRFKTKTLTINEDGVEYRIHFITKLWNGPIQKFHLVDPSPWPILTSLSTLWLTISFVLWFHCYENAGSVLISAIVCLVYTVSLWWRDVFRENLEGHHTDTVIKGIHLGMLLFILTEAMFFVGLLWSFLHAALMPTVQIGMTWPPLGIVPVRADTWHARPILNTWLLLASFFTANNAMSALNNDDNPERSRVFLLITIALGLMFAVYQYLEYNEAAFTFSDSIFGSAFYLVTGFHTFHVLVGVIFFVVVLFNFQDPDLDIPLENVALNLAVLYFHFVDIVWIFVLTIVYIWGGATPSSGLELCSDGVCIFENLFLDALIDLSSTYLF